MKGAVLLSAVMLLSACETIRTVYDEDGKVVSEHAGGEKDITDHFEKSFDSSFSVKKNDKGIPQAVSNRVSRFQKDLDEARRSDSVYSTSSYAGTDDRSVERMEFAGAGKAYSVHEAYTGSRGEAINKDLHPAFATSSRGLYSTADSYDAENARSALEGMRSTMAGGRYSTSESSYSTDDTSGYIESRRDNTPPPRVFSREQYYRKTIDDTRALLGREND